MDRFQILRAYSSIARSEENSPIRAVFMIDIPVQRALFWKARFKPSVASESRYSDDAVHPSFSR